MVRLVVQKVGTVIVACAFIWLLAFFMRSYPITPQMAVYSRVVLIGAALPVYALIIRWAGWIRGVTCILLLSIFALVFEGAAIVTGIPYGFFRYNNSFGSLILGILPWTVAFAWPPLALMSFGTAHLMTQKWPRVLLSTMLLVWFDLLLDPAAVALGFWTWRTQGPFFGVPWTNFGGWAISGFIGSTIVWLFLPKIKSAVRAYRLSWLFWINVALWTAVAFWLEYWIVVGLGVLLLMYIFLLQLMTEMGRLNAGESTQRKSNK